MSMLSQKQTFSKKAIKALLKELNFEKIHRKYKRKVVKTNLLNFVFEEAYKEYYISLEKDGTEIKIIHTDNFEEFLSYIFDFYDILKQQDEKTYN